MIQKSQEVVMLSFSIQFVSAVAYFKLCVANKQSQCTLADAMVLVQRYRLTYRNETYIRLVAAQLLAAYNANDVDIHVYIEAAYYFARPWYRRWWYKLMMSLSMRLRNAHAR